MTWYFGSVRWHSDTQTHTHTDGYSDREKKEWSTHKPAQADAKNELSSAFVDNPFVVNIVLQISGRFSSVC